MKNRYTDTVTISISEAWNIFSFAIFIYLKYISSLKNLSKLLGTIIMDHLQVLAYVAQAHIRSVHGQ